MHLSNSSDEPLAFKVKTTAPKLYCVRPNASIIAPGESVKISLILQGFTQPLPKDYKCKDKFLIVSMPCPELDDPAKVGENWSTLETKYKQQLLQKKLRVNFIIDDDEKDESQLEDTTFANATSGAYGAAGAAAVGATAVAAAVGGEVEHEADTTVNETINRTNVTLNNDTEAASIAAASIVSKQATQDHQKELEAEYAKVDDISEKLDSNASEKQVAVEEAVNGVSLPFAVVLVLIALLLGWYIF